MNGSHDACPPAETILAVVEQAHADRSDGGAVFQHLLHCKECRFAFTFVCAAVSFERDRRRQQTLWSRFRAKVSNEFPHRSDCPGEELIDAIAAGMPSSLILQSSVDDNDSHFWRAAMTFPDVDMSEAPLVIKVEDMSGTPVQNGTFRIFGIEVPIVDGEGQLARDQFAECHHKGGAAFRWQDGSVISGAPVLNA